MLELNKQMNDGMLKMVCGGDYGDTAKDNDVNASMYEIGQEVELYKDRFHFFTGRSTIQDKKYANGIWLYKFITTGKRKVWNYSCHFPKEIWCSANCIENLIGGAIESF